MFCIKICFLEPEPVGIEILWVEPEPNKNLEPEPPEHRKMARLRKTAYDIFCLG